MPKLYNTITKTWQNVGPSDINNPVYTTGPDAEPVVVEEVVEAPKPAAKKPAKKKKAEYISPTTDADGDGLVQDGTIFERPVGTELSPEEVTAIKEAADAE